MFKRLEGADTDVGVNVFVNGQSVSASIGDTVAGVLFMIETLSIRRSLDLRVHRGYYCGMGVCWECTVTIDGQSGVRACLTEVREGMRIVTDVGSHDDV
ncbi:(2Fe-2S)-binding protein [Mesorhizobium sp. M1169]|uniref:(2Fe-2S)-binding protein n=1 Tax=Mesorhizobium sp. M1169 TaxID=2957066 RepID=UPI003339AF3D